MVDLKFVYNCLEVQYSIEPDWRFGGKMATSNQVGSLCDILCPMPSTITQIAVMNGDKVNEQSVNSSVHVINDAFGVFRGARSGRTFNYGMNFDYGDEEDY